MSILFSDKYPVVVLAFRVRNLGSTWLDGTPTSRTYVEKHEMKRQVMDMIEAGRLTLDPEGRRKPVLMSVRGSGGFYAAILEDPDAAEEEEKAGQPGKIRLAQPCMQPVTSYDEERYAMRLIEENRFYDFIELLKAYKPATGEELTAFDGGTIHPISTRTLATEMAVYRVGAGPNREREARTIVLLDRRVSMAEPWSLWEQHPKIAVARFIANAVIASHPNAAVYSFGESLRMERNPDYVEPVATETRLEEALRHVSMLEPGRLIILTDGKPVYIDGVDTDESCEKAVASLDALGSSGVQMLIITLGGDREMERFYSRLEHTPGTRVVPLSIGGDVVRMIHELAEWV